MAGVPSSVLRWLCVSSPANGMGASGMAVLSGDGRGPCNAGEAIGRGLPDGLDLLIQRYV